VPATEPPDDTPKFRYTASLAAEIEAHWQDLWEQEGTFEAPNPAGPLAEPDKVAGRPKLFILDMFPYPSGAGLHVGHPLGFIATDVYGRFKRMTGHNVLHAMGFDAFGLPAEQHAVQTGIHPRVNTEQNIATYRRQLRRLGLAHDARRSIATTDVAYYRWTQWIFLQIFESWYDTDADKARPISELVAELESGARSTPDGRPWAELSPVARRRVVDGYRLAYLADAPVNWCPGLGTVLANEEITSDGRSEIGNFPVFRRNLAQWMLRITAYADRLIADLDRVEWPEPVKVMQRNWIGRSEGASIDFPVLGDEERLRVFTTRPDTVFGATYMVLAPEHPLVDALAPEEWPDMPLPESWTGGFGTPGEAIAAYRRRVSAESDVERQVESREKTGVFVGVHCVNPLTGTAIPVFIADYVLMGYGTGAIMAVPGQDQRDWDFAAAFGLPIIRTVEPTPGFDGEAFTGDGPAINSGFLDGLGVADAKRAIIDWLEANGYGQGTTTYKLRDWLFSRQRYWGEPFPIVYDETGLPIGLPPELLPVELPDVDDYSPQTFDPDDDRSEPVPPLARADHWLNVELDLGDGPRHYVREANVMPQWAGSCWYELRYLDPTNEDTFVDPAVERYWMGPQGPDDVGGVDLYVGGVEHAVLHLLYARFWHKVLFDLGWVSSQEPFHRLFNQGYILADAFTDERGMYVPADEVRLIEGRLEWNGQPVNREHGKMGKSLKNSVTPDDMYDEYGADTMRLYEMSMGPLEQSRPWETRAVVGMYRFLQRLWRNLVDEQTGAIRVSDEHADDATRRLLHRTIAAVRADMDALRFNTAIAKLIELNNHLIGVAAAGEIPREVAEPLVLMAAPLAPHLGEELWARLGHDRSLAFEAFPEADPALLVEDTVEYPVQVNGKVRARIVVPAGSDAAAVEAAALADERVVASVGGARPKRVIVVPERLVNVVL
jgi:leucyl-tRNA synthetase